MFVLKARFEPQLCHIFIKWPWVKYFIALSQLLICKVAVIISQDCCKDLTNRKYYCLWNGIGPEGTWRIRKIESEKPYIMWLILTIRDIIRSNLIPLLKAFLNQSSSSEANTENYLNDCFLNLYQWYFKLIPFQTHRKEVITNHGCHWDLILLYPIWKDYNTRVLRTHWC